MTATNRLSEDEDEMVSATEARAACAPNARAGEKDHAFLKRLRDADLGELIAIAQGHVNGPTWRAVTIVRALARLPRRSGADANGVIWSPHHAPRSRKGGA